MMDTNDAVLSVEDFSQTVFKAVTESRKHVDSLPVSGSDFECWTSYDEFTHLTNHHGKRILNLIQLILSKHNLKTDISSELLDVEERYDLLTDACDQLMDRIGTNLDDASNPKKAASLIVSSRLSNLCLTSSVPTPSSSSSSSSMLMSSSPVAEKPHNASFNKTSVSNYTLMTSKVVTRSQDKFKDKIDNSNSPFLPKITEKPNAMIPLGESLKLEASTEDIDDLNLEYPHPYQYELDLFRPAQQLLEKVITQVPKGVETTPFTYVDTEEKFDELIEKLKSVTEIAVDLEHHSFRSFQGFTCLMQLSTRDEDIIVDTLALRHCIHKINCVFTNPNIIKVLHGADMDVVWLQKDFGVYLVGMFDTGQASRILGLPYFSFAYALQHYCNVKADKQYQLADWRIRPLPAELIKYAREDTHYLLYMYDCMRNDLLHKSNYTDVLLTSAFANSNNLCKKKYQKPRTTETSHRDMYMALKARSSSTKHHLNDRQMEALKQLFAWRDKIARLEDESTGFILPNQMMFQLAEHLPREPEGILACCKPLPTFVKKELADIHRILRNVLELPDSYFVSPIL
ncbi:hypothetical protein HELRODRAFT_112893 [Helobdella robusta]|uniref:Exosome complex component 10 homolog n=1 Tax=Helobdella robusta TaxID=6412 RepID=T1EFN0_HELRO|nr:hypothetical protein HELRODRAFT_112893 [Helobdella robusta]ESO01119.1 hypothetical protein HELRODRAFT_112893 [Helobdella robusta]